MPDYSVFCIHGSINSPYNLVDHNVGLVLLLLGCESRFCHFNPPSDCIAPEVIRLPKLFQNFFVYIDIACGDN